MRLPSSRRILLCTGAKANHLVKEVIANGARFEQAPAAAAPPEAGASVFVNVTVSRAQTAGSSKSRPQPAGYRLSVHPWHATHHAAAHGCKLCPDNLCKVGCSPSIHFFLLGRCRLMPGKCMR